MPPDSEPGRRARDGSRSQRGAGGPERGEQAREVREEEQREPVRVVVHAGDDARDAAEQPGEGAAGAGGGGGGEEQGEEEAGEERVPAAASGVSGRELINCCELYGG